MSYNIGIIGTGYVGLVSGTCFADVGNNVFCVDIDKNKLEKLKNGIPPIYEPGLETILKKNIKDGRIHFTDDLENTVINSEIIFLCLPTPPSEDGSADLKHVLNVANNIAEIIERNSITDFKIIVNKSTVPVGTSKLVDDIFNKILSNKNIVVVSNPEFLREGFAVEDALKPERIVIGTSDSKAEIIMKDLYKPFVRSGNPIIIMDEKSAEITKYAANSFLAVKISFMNDLSAYCEKVGADIDNIRMGIGSDSRIGKRFLFAGIGYGGSCFPKDVQALIHSTDNEQVSLEIVKAAQVVNARQIERFFSKIQDHFTNLSNLKFAIWGLAFKPNTDDTREAPAFRLIEMLLEKNAKICAYDPEAIENTKHRFKDKISYSENMYDCLDNADALIIATEWNLFRNPDFQILKQKLKNNIIFDGRNLWTNDEMKEQGFKYLSIGRVPLT